MKTVWRFCPSMDNANTKAKKCLGSRSTYNNHITASRYVHSNREWRMEGFTGPILLFPQYSLPPGGLGCLIGIVPINLIVTVTLDEATDLWTIIYGYPATKLLHLKRSIL